MKNNGNDVTSFFVGQSWYTAAKAAEVDKTREKNSHSSASGCCGGYLWSESFSKFADSFFYFILDHSF